MPSDTRGPFELKEENQTADRQEGLLTSQVAFNEILNTLAPFDDATRLRILKAAALLYDIEI
jgi:hypothetical protein